MYDSPEIFFGGHKYLQRAGVLYTIRDRESDDDYDPDEDWTFEAWCGPVVPQDVQAAWLAHQPRHEAGYTLYPNGTNMLGPMLQIALYDLDGTLVVSKSGRRWAEGVDDWMWAFPEVPTCLQARAELGITVAIVSNQSDWTRGPEARGKIESVLEALDRENGWRPIVLVATNPSVRASKKNPNPPADPYRKPARGLYDVLLAELGNEEPQLVTMCGDASGSTDSCLAYRWSDSDRVFANNIGALFERPCDVLGSQKKPEPLPFELLRKTQELVVLVGNPGSGKSTTARRFVTAGYVHVEQDTLGSKAQTLNAVKAALATGKSRAEQSSAMLRSHAPRGMSVVVDATHGSAENRAPYIALAESLKIPIRFLWHIRDGRPYNAAREKPVPEIAYAIYTKHFSAPVGNVEIVYG